MSKVRVKTSSRRRNPHALQMLATHVSKQAADAVLDVARHALTVAVQGTPKWSGEATQSWGLYFDKPSATGELSRSSDIPPLRFPEGISDAAAGALNRKVVNSQMQKIRVGLYSKARAGKPLHIFLHNSAPQSQIWLSGEDLTIQSLLRIQNHDYYTMADIRREVEMYSGVKNMSRGFF